MEVERIPRAIDGAEASRRAAWAKFYEQERRASGLASQVHALRSQHDLLLPLLLDLVEAVLTKSKQDAFAQAYRIRDAIDRFLAEHGDV